MRGVTRERSADGVLAVDGLAEQVARQRQIDRPGGRGRRDFESAIQKLRDAIGAVDFGAPLGELFGHFHQVFALGVGVAAEDPGVHLGRCHHHRRAVAVGVVEGADGVGGTGQGAHLRQRRPAGDPRVAIRHGDHAGLVQREHEADFFLIGDGADKFLPAGAGQTENIIDAMVHRDFEISLGYGSLLAAIFSHLATSPSQLFKVQGSTFNVIRSKIRILIRYVEP